MWTGFSMVRIFRPLRSAGVLTARLLLVMWRKPFSPQASASKPLASELLQHVLADRTVQHGAGVVVVAEQEGDVEDRDFRHEVADRAGRGHHQIERADLGALDHLPLRPIGGRDDLELAVAALRQLVAKRRRGDAVMRSRCGRMTELKHRFRLGRDGESKRG